MTWDVKVDAGKCTGCGECRDTCPVDVYEIKNNVCIPANGEECIGCESCVDVCEVAAITVTEE